VAYERERERERENELRTELSFRAKDVRDSFLKGRDFTTFLRGVFLARR
jgi:hypothetical protein